MNNQVLLSRAADAVFWAGRYVERVDNIARAIAVNLSLILDSPISTGEQWAPLYQVTNDDLEFEKRYAKPTQDNVLRFLTFDETYPNSILSCLQSARENARSVREIISTEVWEHVNHLYLLIREASLPNRKPRTNHSLYQEIRLACHLIEGLSFATMSRSEAWHFWRLGQMIERADRTSRILDVKYFILLPKLDYIGSPVDDIQWGAVLKSCSGLEMYRKRHGRLSPDKIVEFLLLDREFPRAVLFCLTEASNSLNHITGSSPGTFRISSEQKLGQLRSELLWSDASEIIVAGLHEYLDLFQEKLNAVGDHINENFFVVPEPTIEPQFQLQ
jgi:uncharacterized alpha-E superfamily protein